MNRQLERALCEMQTGQTTNIKVAHQFAMPVEEVNLLFVQFSQRQRRTRRLKHVLKKMALWVDLDVIGFLLGLFQD